MAAKHGTRRRYVEGCRCEDCTEANRIYKREYRQRRIGGELTRPAAVVTLSQPEPDTPGPVESGVQAEISGLAAEARPGLAQAALAVARVLDNPRAVNQHAAAAKVLSALLDKLHAASAHGRRERLAMVRAMASATTPREVLRPLHQLGSRQIPKRGNGSPAPAVFGAQYVDSPTR
jgi:hypothetical protein